MAHYDVFNGDADGLCALQQFRLAHPGPGTLITGVKRDISLLERTPAGPGDHVLALDISVAPNRTALDQLLERGAKVEWFDHHLPGPLPQHPYFTAHIDTSPTVCTSLLMNHHLHGSHAEWAVVAAFGDNLGNSARQLANQLALPDDHQSALQTLGECLNYNAYGDTVEDLWFHPAELFKRLHPYTRPLDFIYTDSAFTTLQEGFENDLALAEAVVPLEEHEHAAVWRLPDSAWSRRVSGVFGNELATRSPGRAHAILTPKPGGGLTVSVRAPLNNPTGAGQLCAQFPGGGGREGAAGINNLPENDTEHFIRTFLAAW